jgi:hypothetical protein
MLRKILPLLLIALMVNGPFPAQAQSGVTIDSLEIDLWPEYDRPEMLVIYKILLSPQVPLPAELSLRIPTRVGEPNAVAERQGQDLFVVSYEREVQGEWSQVRLTATAPEIQLEYYDPALEKDGRQRQFGFRWPVDYPVQSLTLQVQQPADASGLQVSPGLGQGVESADGLVYYTAPLGALQAGREFELELSYSKETDALSVEVQNLPVEPSAPIDETTPGRVTLRSSLPWVLGGLGVLLIATGVWWYAQLGRAKSAPAQVRRRRRAASPEVEAADGPDGGVFCHQCGKRAGPGDRFCRACGTRLRT